MAGARGTERLAPMASAWNCARRPKQCKLAVHPRLRRLVAAKLSLQWSPEQISRWLSQQHPGEDAMNVSHETIYRSLFVQTRVCSRSSCRSTCRSGRVIRRSKRATRTGQNRGKMSTPYPSGNALRAPKTGPCLATGKATCLTGTNNSHIATLVERRSRFTMLVKVNGKDTAQRGQGALEQVKKPARRAPPHPDLGPWNGALHAQGLQHRYRREGVLLRSAEPVAAGESKQNTNGLLRQYFPVGTRLSDFSQSDLNPVALAASTNGPGRRWPSPLPRICFTERCNDRLNPPEQASPHNRIPRPTLASASSPSALRARLQIVGLARGPCRSPPGRNPHLPPRHDVIDLQPHVRTADAPVRHGHVHFPPSRFRASRFTRGGTDDRRFSCSATAAPAPRQHLLVGRPRLDVGLAGLRLLEERHELRVAALWILLAKGDGGPTTILGDFLDPDRPFGVGPVSSNRLDDRTFAPAEM